MFKDTEHLIRLAVVIIILLAVFVLLRAAVVPESFGQYGHYRGDAIAEIAGRTPAFAGHDVCEGCHTDVVDQLGRHANVACEACHGAQGKHAHDPASVKPQLPDTAVICARCHEANSAKPKAFPQVVTADHLWRPRLQHVPQTAPAEDRRQTENRHHQNYRRQIVDITRRRVLVLLPAAAVAWKYVQAGTPEAASN